LKGAIKMLKFLKINRANVSEELKEVGMLLFGNEATFTVDDDIDNEGCLATEEEKLMFIIQRDGDGCNINQVALYLVHLQYDFGDEKLYGFYEVTACDDVYTREKLDKITDSFNKKSQAI